MTNNVRFNKSYYFNGRFPLEIQTEIRVWLKTLSVDSSRLCNLKSYLSDIELGKAARFSSQKLQNFYIASHGSLREVLGSCIDLHPSVIQLSYNNFGKPALHKTHHSNLDFNLSHSGNYVAIAVAKNRRLGIDIEEIRPSFVTTDLARLVFSESEFEYWTKLSDSIRVKAFYNAWTRKEAFMKAIGSGLSFGHKNIEVVFDPNFIPKLASARDFTNPNSLKNEWELLDLPFNNHYSGAIVVEGSAFELFLDIEKDHLLDPVMKF